jgi:hypothetical protein
MMLRVCSYKTVLHSRYTAFNTVVEHTSDTCPIAHSCPQDSPPGICTPKLYLTLKILCHPDHKSFHFSTGFKYLPFRFLRIQAYTKRSVPRGQASYNPLAFCPIPNFPACSFVDEVQDRSAEVRCSIAMCRGAYSAQHKSSGSYPLYIRPFRYQRGASFDHERITVQPIWRQPKRLHANAIPTCSQREFLGNVRLDQALDLFHVL